jgi:hypothetical protein
MRNFKKNIIIIIHSIIVFFITFLFFEFFLRFSEIILPSFVYDDHELGRTHRANSMVNLVGAEGFYLGEVNKYGYPGKSYPPEKPLSTIRIALIGDSYVEGYQLFQRNHFSNILESRFKNEVHKNVEVLNFGTGGADFRGMFLRYLKLARNYNPDIILFFIKNEDLLQKDAIPMPEPVLFNDSIKFSSTFLNDSQAQIRKKFAFVREFSVGNLFKEVFEVYYTGRLNKIVFDKIYLVFKTEQKNNNINSNNNSDIYYDYNERIISQIKKENLSEKKIIIIEVEDLPLNYEHLLEEYNIPTIKLKDELKKHTIQELKYWKASGKIGHWNQNAHKIIGNYLFKELLRFI